MRGGVDSAVEGEDRKMRGTNKKKQFGYLKTSAIFLTTAATLFLSPLLLYLQPDRTTLYHMLYDIISWNWKVTGEGMLLFAVVPLAAVLAATGLAFLGVALATHTSRGKGRKVWLVRRERVEDENEW